MIPIQQIGSEYPYFLVAIDLSHSFCIEKVDIDVDVNAHKHSNGNMINSSRPHLKIWLQLLSDLDQVNWDMYSLVR